MSANDEIRKALLHALPIGLDRVSQSDHDRILTALAHYLAPHPAQQGEDGIAELTLELHRTRQKYCDGFVNVPFCELAGAVDKFIARSHSKQEGGA